MIPSSSTRVLLVSVEMSSFTLLYIVIGRTILQSTVTTLFHTLLVVNIAALNITKLSISNEMTGITIASYIHTTQPSSHSISWTVFHKKHQAVFVYEGG